MFNYSRMSRFDMVRYQLKPPAGYRLYPIWSCAAFLVVPTWVVRLLQLRDRAARSWALHCFNLRLVDYGQMAPWPNWLRWGWN